MKRDGITNVMIIVISLALLSFLAQPVSAAQAYSCPSGDTYACLQSYLALNVDYGGVEARAQDRQIWMDNNRAEYVTDSNFCQGNSDCYFVPGEQTVYFGDPWRSEPEGTWENIYTTGSDIFLGPLMEMGQSSVQERDAFRTLHDSGDISDARYAWEMTKSYGADVAMFGTLAIPTAVAVASTGGAAGGVGLMSGEAATGAAWGLGAQALGEAGIGAVGAGLNVYYNGEVGVGDVVSVIPFGTAFQAGAKGLMPVAAKYAPRLTGVLEAIAEEGASTGSQLASGASRTTRVGARLVVSAGTKGAGSATSGLETALLDDTAHFASVRIDGVGTASPEYLYFDRETGTYLNLNQEIELVPLVSQHELAVLDNQGRNKFDFLHIPQSQREDRYAQNTDDGGIQIIDSQGTVVGEYSSQQVRQIAQQNGQVVEQAVDQRRDISSAAVEARGASEAAWEGYYNGEVSLEDAQTVTGIYNQLLDNYEVAAGQAYSANRAFRGRGEDADGNALNPQEYMDSIVGNYEAARDMNNLRDRVDRFEENVNVDWETLARLEDDPRLLQGHPQHDQAVIELQESLGVSADGYIGSESLTALAVREGKNDIASFIGDDSNAEYSADFADEYEFTNSVLASLEESGDLYGDVIELADRGFDFGGGEEFEDFEIEFDIDDEALASVDADGGFDFGGGDEETTVVAGAGAGGAAPTEGEPTAEAEEEGIDGPVASGQAIGEVTSCPVDYT